MGSNPISATIINLKELDMISTWGIFWIAFFSAMVLKCLIVHLLPFKMKPLSNETWKHLKDISDNFIDRVTINIATTPTKKEKETEEQA